MKTFLKYPAATLILWTLILQGTILSAQETVKTCRIEWKGLMSTSITRSETVKYLYFTGAEYNLASFGYLPLYQEEWQSDNDCSSLHAEMIDATWEKLEPGLAEIVKNDDIIESDWIVKTEITASRGIQYGRLIVLPLRKNAQTGAIEKLTAFSVQLTYSGSADKQGSTNRYADNSVLSSGDWYRIAVSASGIYKISYNDLIDYGMDPASIDPRHIRIYGGKASMLPESNFEISPDDLTEMAIMVAGEEDGIFNQADYILFYGQSPTIWNYNPFRIKFEHKTNLYSDYIYYFLTPDKGPGKRIINVYSTTSPPTDTATKFNDFTVHEEDLSNLIKSGKEWYGEKLDPINNSLDLDFYFPNIDTSSEGYIRFFGAARSTENSFFNIYANGSEVISSMVTGISANQTTIFARKNIAAEFIDIDNDNIDIQIEYEPPTAVSLAWLNYLEVNVVRHLIFTGEQMPFRDLRSLGHDKVTDFQLTADEQIPVWEVTDPMNVKRVQTSYSSGIIHFRLLTDTLREFIAYDGSLYFQPVFIEKIINQNLHSIDPVDLVIVSHPLFLEHAKELASIHAEKDDMSVVIVTPQQIYNEFSGGKQDIAAIRNFTRMIYSRQNATKEFKYLLLFGDGSFDYKDRLQANTNFVPTFQSDESLLATASFISDDFFGLFDPEEGNDCLGTLDIGVGRIPVSTVEDADHHLNKLKHYISNSSQVMNSWRNVVCFIADDEDGNLHFNQAEEMATYVDTNFQQLNLDKIYLDAYNQQSSTNGHRYPDANAKLNERVNDGALIINYTGHGGEDGWTEERVLEISDIDSWSNFDNMPLFVTATCEFSRYDDPARIAAGEHVFLNPNGASIAMITTTRLAFAQANFTMNKRFYQHVFSKTDDGYNRLGDLIRLSKSPSNDNIRNIHLLGDPALQLAYPKYKVLTTSVNNSTLETFDTVHALSLVNITGKITTDMGNLVNNFDGIIYIEVYDKASTLTTLGNDPKSLPAEFLLRKDCIHRGRATVTHGEFSYSFIIPKSISYEYGFGKISYYAENEVSDASGYFDDLLIGGIDENAHADNTGPAVNLYLNDKSFTSGEKVNKDPVLLAELSDPSGINYLGIGIGHDILATLYSISEESIVLNTFFIPDLDNYQSGTITFPFTNLQDGYYSLTLKAWDMANNSSLTSIDFIVSGAIPITIKNLITYPNPFNSYTTFRFDHNQFNEDLIMEIYFYDIFGRLVNYLGPLTVTSEGYHSGTIQWNGTNINGDAMRRGTFIYKAIINTTNGSAAELTGKLILMN